MDNETKTPRTDAEYDRLTDIERDGGIGFDMAEFARTLERELAALAEKLQHAHREVVYWSNRHADCHAAHNTTMAAKESAERRIEELEPDARRLDAIHRLGISLLRHGDGWKYRFERGPNSPWFPASETARDAIDAALKETP